MVIGVGCGSMGPARGRCPIYPGNVGRGLRAGAGRGTEAGTGRNGVAGMGGPSGLVQGGAEDASMDRVERVEKFGRKNKEKEKRN